MGKLNKIKPTEEIDEGHKEENFSVNSSLTLAVPPIQQPYHFEINGFESTNGLYR